MQIKIQKFLTRQNLQLFTFTAACVVGSFVMGIKSAGDVHTIEQIEAMQASVLETTMQGDMNADGSVTVSDAILLLQMIQDTTLITAHALQADPSRDGELTVSDAVLLLQSLLH